MNIIFGPMHQNQIKPLSDFAEKNDIRLVIPFSQKGEEVFNNPAVYQINTPQSYLYSEVYEALHPSISQCKRYLHRTGER